MQESLNAFERRIEACLIRDRHSLRRRLQRLNRRLREKRPIDHELEQLAADIDKSVAQLQERRDRLPSPIFPEDLPINQRREQIAAAIREHQVVVVCGETGSGKTTQIPKICLSLGLGAAGMIGHTQPRRIAARSVAARIAEELNTQLGRLVGYKVRFSDRVGPDSAIKLMTDGILLAETQGDRYLEQYEVLIVDEAHERSLNIDFLLGYLRRLLPKRPDLKVIITSATIDPERFSRHFNNAPIIEVSGRTYPVELRYRPLAGENEDDRDRDIQQAILDAVDEVFAAGPGDCLVFLSGEREIREIAESLRKHHPANTEILPLYARLSASEQNKVFQAHQKKRIVLATNVAETSLTVPGIRYVIDPGYARISRYGHRSKVQRLPIEAISQASARQRAGRCGRVSAGVCIRLYAEEDFQSRSAFTDPEILRTNLAAVILQMAALNLGEVEDFPFIDPPDTRLIADGFRLLFELGAVDARRSITDLGRQLARLPIDPRLARMLMAARDQGCLKETLVIASALAIQDPRERPLDKQQAADEKHRRFYDQRSDFAALLNLWDYYQSESRHRSGSQMRKLCREDFLSFVRMREWRDLHQQLKSLIAEMGMRINDAPADYDSLHRALLAGLLGHIGLKQEDAAYLGARNRKFYIFPGSGLFKKAPKWVMAAELVETTRLYGRTVAKINPDWIEGLAGHLVKRSYSDPHWEKRPAQVAAKETVTLYGLPIVPERRINYGPIAPAEAREIFIRRALVEGDFHCNAAFFKHNQELIKTIEELEQKGRRRDVLADEETLFNFYDERIPEGIYSGPDFYRWLKKTQRADPELLFMTQDLLMAHGAAEVTGERFPDHLDLDGLRLPLVYRFEPGEPDDGVTLIVPLAALNQVDPNRLDWLVPGLLESRVTALLKSLPKSLRRHFVPAPDYARALLEVLKPEAVPLTGAMAKRLFKITGVEIPADAWKPETVPEHLRMNVRVVDAEGRTLMEGRDLGLIKEGLKGRASESFEALPTPEYERNEVKDWDFGELPEEVEFTRNNIQLKGYPALVAQPDHSVALRLLDRREDAEAANRLGLRRLFALRARDSIKHLQRSLPGLQQMSLHYIGVGAQEELREDLIDAIIDRVFLGEDPPPRNRETFEQRLERGRRQLPSAANEICVLVRETLAAYHELRKLLSGEMPLSLQAAAEDIREQLDWLIYKGFVANTPHEWRQHLPRYLKAIILRLKKLEQAPDKDRLRRADIDALWRRFRDRYEKNVVRGVRDPALEQFRWMLEELRVSVFAQELRTAFPVSVKRLEEQWAKVRG